ncbi:rubrerythrin, partial [Candidatus Gastranaerophilus sp. (ex Termes propinquus)]
IHFIYIRETAEKNLMKAFAGEAQARNRYTYYSEVAKQEGYEQIAGIFLETAGNELEHARLFFGYLGDKREVIDFTAAYPIGLGNTVENLENAFLGEMEENTTLYPEYGKTAEEEGFADVAATFKHILVVEKHHEARYRALQKNILEDVVFKRPEAIEWKCRNCGYLMNIPELPPKCPFCHYPRAFFEISCDNF